MFFFILFHLGRQSPCRRLSAGGGEKYTAAGGRSLLLIRAADPPSWISRRFLPLVALPPGVAKSSHSDHPSFPPTIRATCKAILRPAAGIYLPREYQ